MVELGDLHEGDKLVWNTVNGTARGFVVKENDDVSIYLSDGGIFRAADIVTKNNNVKIVGRVNITTRSGK